MVDGSLSSSIAIIRMWSREGTGIIYRALMEAAFSGEQLPLGAIPSFYIRWSRFMASIPARPGKLILFLKHICIFYCPQSVETALVRGSGSLISHHPVLQVVKQTRTLVPRKQVPQLIIIWASSTKKRYTQPCSESKRVLLWGWEICHIIWACRLSKEILSPIFSWGTQLRGTSVRVNLTPRGTYFAQKL